MDKQFSQLTRIEKKKRQTQELIINVTIDLVEKQGFNETTMEEIAKLADIAKGTLYNYYSSKEEIISAYIKRSFKMANQDRMKDIENLNTTRERLFFLFDTLLDGVKRHKELFEKYLIYQMSQMVSFNKDEENKSGIDSPVGMIIKMGQASGEIRKDLSAEMLSEFVLFVFIELVKTYYLNAETFDQVAGINQSVSLFLNGTQISGKEAIHEEYQK